MISNQHTWKKNFSHEFVAPNEKIFDQLEVLRTWWEQLDPKGTGQILQSEFLDLLLTKKIIYREKDFENLIQGSIGKADHMSGKLKIITDFQYKKIFAKALLKGAISNIFEYTKFLQNHDNDMDQ